MPPKDDNKQKDTGKLAKKDKDPVNKSGGKAKKKKWSKDKVRDKLHKLVLFDKATYDKLCKEVPSYKLISPAIVSKDGRFVAPWPGQVSKHRAQVIYARNTEGGDAPTVGDDV